MKKWKTSRTTVFFAVFSVVFAVSFAVVFYFHIKNREAGKNQINYSAVAEREEKYNSGFFDLAGEISGRFAGLSVASKSGEFVQVGITSHHLPTAMPAIADFYEHLALSAGPRDVFVVIGPDHFERCGSPITLTQRSYITPFGETETGGEIAGKILDVGFKEDDGCMDGEHSIGVQVMFIKYLFPNAKIVPLVVSSSAKESSISGLVEILYGFREKITVIISADFSHYKTAEDAKKQDGLSAQMIEKMESAGFNLELADSPASVILGIELAKKLGAESGTIIRNANSYEFTGRTENTTGYISATFAVADKSERESVLVFVGDIMLSRNVGEKMKKESDWRWPFLKVADYLQKADLVFGNLEGPISDKGVNVGSKYSFRADPKSVEGLKYAGFDVLSVANNHINDWSRAAMQDTFRILKNSEIDYAGGGFDEKESRAPVVKKAGVAKIAYFAYTAIGPIGSKAGQNMSGINWLEREKMTEDIKNAETVADIIVVSAHFGEEYKTVSNSYQKNIARAAIDNGADLFIGHHPHVVQETEEYNGGYIAYSLGNFVFDQTFSKETMEGMILEAKIKNKKITGIIPAKVTISKMFQPELGI